MDNEDLIKTVRQRYQKMVEADNRNRREAMEDFKFINEPGYQWDEYTKTERGDRPCYEFNKLRITSKRIINDMRANTPQGKVRGVEGGDKDVAEIYEGLIRNIWNISDGDTVVDYASEYQVGAGMGAWRVVTDWADDSFNQDIKLEAIPNPFCLYADHNAKGMLKEDAQDWILTEKISKAEFEKKYPKAEKIEFDENEFDDEEDWSDDDSVRLAEYWYKEPVEKEIWQLQDGKVIDGGSDEAKAIPEEMIVKKRRVMTEKIMMCIASGDSILEGPTEWAGKYFPFVMIYGEYLIIDGKTQWHGIARFAKDAQRSYNISRTAITETIAMAPQAKFWATGEQAKGHTDKWAEAHKQNFPFLLFNADPKNPGAPQRMGGADVPVALIQESQLASEEIKAVTGIFDESMGAQGDTQSGRAIYARQQQGEIATFNYQDNRAKGIKRTWDILIDLIPKIYDTERELRVLGSDGVEDYKKINTFVPGPNGEPIKVNDLSMGKYDTTVTIGPSFSTRRQEASEIYNQLMQGNPEIFGIAGDLVFKSMDLPYAEDIAERLRIMLPPQIQQMINDESPIPPEVMAMMEQAQQAMAQVQEQAQIVQQQYAELEAKGRDIEAKNHEVELSQGEVEKLITNLDKQKAQFEAYVAKEVSSIMDKFNGIQVATMQAEKQAKTDEDQRQVDTMKENLSAALAGEMAQSLQGIQAMAEQFTVSAQHIAAQPKIARIDMVRENGVTSAVPVYE